jgi:TRAP-type C4-dicarboxylate transport system substrate-binding protein
MRAMRFVAVVAAICGFLAASPAASAIEIKVATLAPKNSAWAKALEDGGRDANKQTTGRVVLKYFFGGQQGDERDMVRKMQSGALDGAVLTAVGLGMLVPEIRVLELPTMFKNTAELDFVRDAMTPRFEKMLADKGYILLSWGDVGWVHTFGTRMLSKIEDMRTAKAWVWTDDPITRAMLKRLGINSVPLGVPQVLTALSTGQIDSCYGSPLAAVALQWYTKLKFASDTPLSYAIGGFVVRKDVFDKLSAEDQKVFLTGSRDSSKRIIAGIRKDNERAKKAMQKSGVQFIVPPPETMKVFEEASKNVWKDLVGTLYDEKLLAEVLEWREKARKK